MAERVASGEVCQEWRDSLCIAVENALAFMAQDRGFEPDDSTTLGYGVHLAQQRFEARI
ncbi:hypothetical protein [Rhizorhabdus histidinilytica]|uniref:hypothetical protein n=1 Tax=Rhizorhabdus histidinilytica TaxID=439228 RepID=UPI00321FB843